MQEASQDGSDAGQSPMFSFLNIKKSYGSVEALVNGNLRIYPGRCHAIVGDNGAGKSTAMRMIGATSQRTSGELTILDKDPEKFGPQIRAHLGVVPQQDNLDTQLSVTENLYIYGRYFGLNQNFSRERLKNFSLLPNWKRSEMQKLNP